MSRQTVFLAGYLMLAASVLGIGAVGWSNGTGLRAGAAALVLALLITLYNRRHKDNPLGPLVMGLCRVFVYVSAALCVTESTPAALWIGAALLLCHLIGLTFMAKHELRARMEDIWPTVVLLIPLVYSVTFVLREPVAVIFWIALAGALYVALRAVKRRASGDVGFAVATLIAAISLIDALLIAAQGRAGLSVLAFLGFPLTLTLQRFVKGT